MGTHRIKQWTACLQTIDAIASSSEEVDAAASSATALVDALANLEPCPKATWKKLVIELQV